MCTYNGEKYLREQLDSIVNQTYPIYELIVQDDCSTDNTVDIVREYQKEYPFISIYANETNKGVAINFMSAFQKANGEFIAVSDQDDIWMLDKIEKQIKTIKNGLLCYSLSKPFSEGNMPIDIELRIPNVGIERQIFYPIIPGHAMVFRSTMLKLIPPKYLSTYIYDHLLAMVAIIHGNILVCDEVLSLHRRHINAHSYVVPENYERTFVNSFRYFHTGITRYFQKKEQMRNYFGTMHTFLLEFSSLQFRFKETLLLTKYLSEKSLLSLLKASFLCIKMRDGIFYAKEKKELLAIIRAFFFPFLCSKYY